MTALPPTRCPRCGAAGAVIGSRIKSARKRRRRSCSTCQHRWPTEEAYVPPGMRLVLVPAGPFHDLVTSVASLVADRVEAGAEDAEPEIDTPGHDDF